MSRSQEILLKDKLRNLFHYEHVILFGRARSGIAALLDVVKINKGLPFLIPSNICSSVFLAARYSGAVTKLVPINSETGLTEDQEFLDAMRIEQTPGVVMPTHLYGFVGRYPKTIKYAKEAGWIVLENDTVATNANLSGYIRGFGDLQLLSFGYSKVIDGGIGGALLTNDLSMARELQSRVTGYPLISKEAIASEVKFMMLERSIRSERINKYDGSSGLSHESCLINFDLEMALSYDVEYAQNLINQLDKFQSNVCRRLELFEYWSAQLAPYYESYFQAPKIKPIVPWRFILLMKSGRDRLINKIRSMEIEVGTNYPDLNVLYPSIKVSKKLNDGIKWGDQVINFWLEPNYSKDKVINVVKILEQGLKN